MNVQTHMSGGQVPDQGGLPQQNGNVLPPNQMQNLVGGVSMAASIAGGLGVPQQHNTFNVDPDLLRARDHMLDKILGMLLHRHSQPVDETQRTKFRDIAKRLEEGLFKAAHTKEEYMNMDTLEHRLSCLIKGRPRNSHNQRHRQLVNSSSSIGTMIPTPGMSHSGNSSLMITSSVDSASGCNTVAPTTVNSGNLLSTGGIQSNSYNRSDGTLSNGYQQSPANFSIGAGGNMPSVGVQGIASQMSCMNLEPNNGDGFSAVETLMESQPQKQKQHDGDVLMY